MADARARLVSPRTSGFWIHVDADVFDPTIIPAVDTPQPGGFTVDGLIELLAPLVEPPEALGLELTIYDPELDADRRSARAIVHFLEQLLR